MTDEEKIIRVNTIRDFARGRDGDETLEVPAWIAENTASSPRTWTARKKIREAVRDPYTNDW